MNLIRDAVTAAIASVMSLMPMSEAPPAPGTLDNIAGMTCGIGQDGVCQLNYTRSVQEIVDAYDAEELPATRLECFLGERDDLQVCAAVPVDWPELVTREEADMWAAGCAPLPDGSYACPPKEETK